MSKNRYPIILLILCIALPNIIIGQKEYRRKKKDPKSQATFGSTSTSYSKPGKRQTYWENGNKKRFENLNDKGFREGDYKEWYENGTLKTEEHYRNGRRDGLSIKYHPSGKIHIKAKYMLVTRGNGGLGIEERDVLNGLTEEYYENGQLKKKYPYVNGAVDGEYKEWYENGQLAKVGTVRDEFNTGIYKEFHENGIEKLVGEYKKNSCVGKWVATHDNGKTHYVELFETNNSYLEGSRGRRIDGDWTSYHPNGEVEMKGQYREGRKQDVWREYYDNNREKSVVKYKDDKRIGMFVEFYSDGTKKMEGEYGESKADINRSRKEGTWVEWYENGAKRREVSYIKGRREGKSSEWYANGQKKLETTYAYSGRKESMFHGLTTEWHENGQEKYSGLYDMGRRMGEWKEYNEEGIVMLKAYYDKAKLSGRVTTFYPNGQKESEGEYKMTRIQKKTGAWEEWYENGNVKFKGNFVNGERKGAIYEYYENGQLSREAFYDDDIIVGFVREFYEDGTKKIDGNYCDSRTKRGLKCGKWQVWNEAGEMVKDQVFDNGKLVD